MRDRTDWQERARCARLQQVDLARIIGITPEAVSRSFRKSGPSFAIRAVIVMAEKLPTRDFDAMLNAIGARREAAE